MEEPKNPDRETQRLQKLLDYNILDTGPEACFDEITQLASKICECEISLVSLIDSDRQWFKSKVGLTADETPRAISFCGHAILKYGVFEIPNALEDERFADNPLVTDDPEIRFYAGAPLVTPSGDKVGTLCVIDKKPKKLSLIQLEALQVLSSQVVSQLELRKQNLILQSHLRNLKNDNTAFENAKRNSEVKGKLDSLATLAGGLAHEINNPLMIISGNVNLLRNHLKQTEINRQTFTDKLDKISETVFRITAITEGLLHYSGDSADISKSSIAKLTKEAIFMWEEKLKGYGTDLTHFIDSSIDFEITKSHFIEVFNQLLNNAFFETKKQKSAQVEIRLEQDESNIYLIFKDSGKGIEPDDLSKIFTPFFTTKPVGVGTGLGLSIVCGIVSNLQGDISYKREDNKTWFTVSLPKNQMSQP